MAHGSVQGARHGSFIVFEGIDGSGKSTVAAVVAQRIQGQRDQDVILTREPGGTSLGEGIRALVLSEASAGITPIAELLLFSAARAQHIAEVIEPQLRNGAIVLCDRFTDSTLAYQWGGRGVSRRTVESAQELATGGVSPDLRVLLDLPVCVALSRRHSDLESVNRFDAERVAFHQSVRDAYLKLAQERQSEWIVVDANQPVQDVAEATYRRLSERMRDAQT